MHKISLAGFLVVASVALSAATAQTAAPDAATPAANPPAAPAPAAADTDADAPVTEDSLIVDFAYSGANTDAEVVSGAKDGLKVYKDSDLTYDKLPTYLIGASFIRPYMADASEGSSTDQYQMDLLKYSYVYLMIDSANEMPANNDNETYKWVKLTDTYTLNKRTMDIYKSRLMNPYDNVYLATNGHGITRFDPKSNMYLLFVVNQEVPLIKPGLTVTASGGLASNPPAMAIDGKAETAWTKDDKAPTWIKIDFGQKCGIGRYNIDWLDKADAASGTGLQTKSHPCVIEVSDDDKTYRVSVDNQKKIPDTDGEVRVPPLNVEASRGRYVRITIPAESTAIGIKEVRIDGALLEPQRTVGIVPVSVPAPVPVSAPVPAPEIKPDSVPAPKPAPAPDAGTVP